VNAISDADADHRVTLTIPTLRLTSKQSPRSPVLLVVYRTADAGTVFFQVSSVTSPTLNSTTADTVTFVDNVTDATLEGNAQIYTTGNVIENIAPNPVSALAVCQNRIFYVDSTNPLQLGYSKQVVPGTPVEFSDLFTLNLNPVGGDATTVAEMDGKVIIFRSERISFITGTGPDAAGGNNDFSADQLITSDSGCVNPRSVVLTPVGLMYKSSKGIYLLDRSLQVSYVGSDMEQYNEDTITSAELIASTNQVRFTLASGVALVFDYFERQWSVFTNVAAVDACIFEDRYTYLRSDGTVRRETPGVFSDAGNYIKLKVVTSWLQLAGLQGFQRARRFMVLGDYYTAHRLVVQVAYDFNPSFAQSNTIDAGDLLDTVAYGEGAYGAGVYGGTFPLYQWKIHLARQKCEAIQVSIEDDDDGSGAGEGFSITGLSLEVGVKRGLTKPPASRSAG